jgi:hypothetical protein
MQSINWFNIIREIYEEDKTKGSLNWGLPEQWLQTELYAKLKQRFCSSGWKPFDTEIPYITEYPVYKRKQADKNAVTWAVKWVDLCIYNKQSQSWIWFELKIRHMKTKYERAIGSQLDSCVQKTQKKILVDARHVYKKDVVALAGFDSKLTACIWQCLKEPRNIDEYPKDIIDVVKRVKSYWLSNLKLWECADYLESGRHYYVAAFSLLNGALDNNIWNDCNLRTEIKRWYKERSKDKVTDVSDIMNTKLTHMSVDQYQNIADRHSLVLTTWSEVI